MSGNNNNKVAVISGEQQLVAQASGGVFSGVEAFEVAQRMGKMLATSKLVPTAFANNLGDCVVALEMAQRIGASPLAVMQNLHIIHGKPSWSSQFIIGALNSSGKFSPLRFDMSGEGMSAQCFAWAMEKGSGERLEGPVVSMQMAKDEGWLGKAGSKWKTMPDLMLRYRAAAFFGRLYAPEILMGMRSEDEVIDISSDAGAGAGHGGGAAAADDVNAKITAPKKAAPKKAAPKKAPPKEEIEDAEIVDDPLASDPDDPGMEQPEF